MDSNGLEPEDELRRIQQPSVYRIIKSQVLRIQQAKDRPNSSFFCRFDPSFDFGPSHGLVSPEIISGTR